MCRRDVTFEIGRISEGAPNPDAGKQFIDFALSPEGQQIVTQVGYFPVK